MKAPIVQEIGQSLRDFFNKNTYSKCCVLVDENTYTHCLPQILPYLPDHEFIQIESGEENKTLETCSNIWKQMTKMQLDRKSLVVNLGGGVIGDMGGFCAATYKRGVDFINIPTTLLSQVDASVGGKLGIDFEGFKNHIGVFCNPKQVFLDPIFLSTLPKRELRSGFAEIIKHALIASSKQWELLVKTPFEHLDLKQIIGNSVAIKAEIVNEDPTEKGKRKLLNFGHSVGHAVESYFLPTENKILHGEAVAIGMICEAKIAADKQLISVETSQEIAAFILQTFGKVIIQPSEFDGITNLIYQDKKNEGSKILMALIDTIGSAIWDVDVTIDEVKSSLQYYHQL